VVEFWATWCGPCIVMMPHMSDLQAEYKSKGVTFVGFSSKDTRGNDEKSVTEFVKKRDKLKYTFAYADDRDTNDAWMRAAGQNGIPCCFVVGKDTKIAWIGHPMYLDVVLPKVAAGTWKNDEDGAAVEKIKEEVNEMAKQLSGNPEEGYKAMVAFDAKYPGLSHIPYFTPSKLNMMLKGKMVNETKKFAEDLMARSIKQDDPMPLRTISAVLRGPDAKDNKELVTISVNAAEAALKIAGDKDPQTLLNAAESYLVAGNKAKAKEYAGKAVTAAEGEPANLKNFITKQAKKFEDAEEKKDK